MKKKKKICIELYGYIKTIKKILLSKPEWYRFLFTVLDKLFELVHNEKCIELEKYFIEIFQIDYKILKEWYDTNK